MKILILGWKLSNSIGGIETFNRKIIESFGADHDFFEVVACKDIIENEMVRSSFTNSEKFFFNLSKSTIEKIQDFGSHESKKETLNFGSHESKKEKLKLNKKIFLIIPLFIKKGIKKIKNLRNKKKIINKNTKVFNSFIKSKNIELIICPITIDKDFNLNIKQIKKKKIGIVHGHINNINKKFKMLYDNDIEGVVYKKKRISFFLKDFKLNYFDKIVVSNPLEAQILKNSTKNYEKILFINFCAFKKELLIENKNNLQNNVINKNKIIYVGRLSQFDKNIKELNKIACILKKYQIEIDVYGNGPDIHLLNSDNINLHGAINEKELKQVYLNAKILLLTSWTEGGSYAICEALSYGVIPICYDTFLSCFWTLDNQRGKIIKNLNSYEFAQEVLNINSLDNFKTKESSLNNINFAIQNLCYDSFQLSWNEIFK